MSPHRPELSLPAAEASIKQKIRATRKETDVERRASNLVSCWFVCLFAFNPQFAGYLTSIPEAFPVFFEPIFAQFGCCWVLNGRCWYSSVVCSPRRSNQIFRRSLCEYFLSCDCQEVEQQRRKGLTKKTYTQRPTFHLTPTTRFHSDIVSDIIMSELKKELENVCPHSSSCLHWFVANSIEYRSSSWFFCNWIWFQSWTKRRAMGFSDAASLMSLCVNMRCYHATVRERKCKQEAGSMISSNSAWELNLSCFSRHF